MAAGIDESLEKEQQMVDAGNLHGAYVEQVGRAGRLYRLEAAYLDNSRAYHQIAADLDARDALSQESHTATANAYLGKNLRDSGSEFNTADPSIRVEVLIGESALADPDSDGGAEILDQEDIIDTIADADNLFQYGSNIDPYPTPTSGQSQTDRVNAFLNVATTTGPDGQFLAERSKQTGEKMF